MEEILEILKRIEQKMDDQNLSDEKGVIRKCDSLGRITLPANIRKNFNIDENTEIKIIQNKNSIILFLN